MLLNSSTGEEYLKKLEKCLSLIFNDQPDHQDDTIILKLLDSLQSRIEEETKRGVRLFIDSLRSFVSTYVFDSDLNSKEPDIIKFCFDLISLTLKSPLNEDDSTYLNGLLTCIDQFTTDSNIVDINPASLISLIRLLCQLDEISDSTTTSLLNQYRNRVNARFLNAASHILDFDTSPSVYLRREFVKFYLNRLNAGDVRINTLTWSNLDLTVEFIKHKLISSCSETTILDSKQDDILNRLKLLGEDFAQKQSEFLIDTETTTMKNETQIEAFAWMSGFSVLLAFMSPCEMDKFQNQKEVLVNEKFSKTLNKICNHLATRPLNQDLASPLKQYRSRFNFMFTFMLSLYSFLSDENFVSSPSLNRLLGFDFRPAREAFKYMLVQYLCSPLYAKLNNSSSTSTLVDNYVLLLNELDLNMRKCAVSLAASNLRSFSRRFKSSSARLLDFIESGQIVYLLKHDCVDIATKNDLINLCSDVFSSLNSLNSSQTDYLTFVYRFIIDDCLDLTRPSVSRLISESLVRLGPLLDLILFPDRWIASTGTLARPAELNCMHLLANGGESRRKAPAETDKFGSLVEFMANLMDKQPNHTKFELVWKVLQRDDFKVLRIAVNYLIVDDEEAAETLNDLRQTIYMLLNGILKISNLKSESFEAVPITSSTIQMLEKRVNSETEAFVRREMISFLSSYHMNRLHHATASNSSNLTFFASLQFFSRTLTSDLDWQCQLNCVTHLAAVMRQVTSDLDSYPTLMKPSVLDDEQFSFSQQFTRQLESASPIQIVFVYSDCLSTLVSLVTSTSYHDRSVCAAVADLLISIKQNDLLVSRLDCASLNSISMSTLESIVAESKLSSDLYSTCPNAILDDIISSYQFDIDEEKAVDCY